jgi:hypothetical protein
MRTTAFICALGWTSGLFGFRVALAAPDPPTLSFRIDEGRNINSFLRRGPVAAHLLLRSGNEPRLLVAFPAGNSGVGLWFERTPTPTSWTLTTPPRPHSARDAQGRPLHGIEFTVEVSAPELVVRGAVLSSVRVLRDYELLGRAPAEVAAQPRIVGRSLAWSRDRLDGAAGYQLSIEVQGDAQVTARKIRKVTDAPLRLKVLALTGETPLMPLDALLAPGAAHAGDDSRARNALAFLSYQEKYLAGSWRFDTYFGRDTLISALLLAPVLEASAMESAIASVLDRLAPNGEVAHEEDIGEFAVLRNSREGRAPNATPIYDYGMVDDDFLLAPLAARWLLADSRGRARAAAFLAARSATGEKRGDLLARNLTWMVERTAAFAADPRAGNLVSIKAGRMTGNWRDSEQGLGRGRLAFDVNAALIPAALAAAADIHDAGLLAAYLPTGRRETLAAARAQARVWEQKAPALFAVEIPADVARAGIAAYAREVGVEAEAAAGALGKSSLAFQALSLDEGGKPVPIMNSDEGFRLLLNDPPAAELARSMTAIMRPFPAGLLTEAGLLVANPAHAPADLRREFTRFAYHGTVVWSWQQALLAAGIDRQLRRRDLPEPLRAQLHDARKELWRVIGNSSSLRTSELWSWSSDRGRLRAEPFGRPGADADESNAAQLWSTVYLGLTRPD